MPPAPPTKPFAVTAKHRLGYVLLYAVIVPWAAATYVVGKFKRCRR